MAYFHRLVGLQHRRVSSLVESLAGAPEKLVLLVGDREMSE